MSERRARTFVVCGPETSEVAPVCDDGTGPVEVGRDCYLVRAFTRADARLGALRLADQRGDNWPDENRGNGVHPLKGVTVDDPFSPDDADPTSWSGHFIDMTAAADCGPS